MISQRTATVRLPFSMRLANLTPYKQEVNTMTTEQAAAMIQDAINNGYPVTILINGEYYDIQEE